MTYFIDQFNARNQKKYIIYNIFFIFFKILLFNLINYIFGLSVYDDYIINI